ncbi:MAG TPA: hypothetical protein VK826_10395 [Bacteroidia bacterium]|nr:hypothetical protein [Bacteroidia bacterium]
MNTVLGLNNIQTNSPISIDFSGTRFVSPIVIAGLSALHEHYLALGISSKITTGINAQSYLDTVHFPAGVGPDVIGLEEFIRLIQTFESKTYLPITVFPATVSSGSSLVRNKALSALGQVIKSQLKLSGSVFSAIMYLISELTNNVADHSGTDKGRIMAQYFPSKNYMDVCIADCGKGLLQSYLDSGKFELTSDEEAIQLALSGKSTKEDAVSRGFGIPTSKRMLTQGLRGKIFIWSGEALYYEDAEKTQILSFRKVSRWQGCFIAMRIPTQNIADFNIYQFVS